MARLKQSKGCSCGSVTRSQTTAKVLRTPPTETVAVQTPISPRRPSHSTNKRRYRPGEKVLSEIRRYQKGTGLLVPKSPYRRVVRQISQDLTGKETLRFTAEAMECLQVASEAMIIQLFEDSVLVMVNAKRKTLMVRDMEIVKRIRGGF